MLDDIRRAFKRAVTSSMDHRGTPGLIGKLDGSTVNYTLPDGTASTILAWVRIGGAGTPQQEVVAVCKNAPRIYGYPVRVDWIDGRWVVLGADGAFANETDTGGYPIDVAPHAHTHGRFGTDPLYITGSQFLPLSVQPTNPFSMTVTVKAGFYRYLGTWKYIAETTTASLGGYVPAAASTQHFIIVCLDRANNAVVIVDGIDVTDPVTTPVITATHVLSVSIDETYHPLAAVRFWYGQTKINPQDIIFDTRLWGGEYDPLDINGLTEETEPDAGADYVAIYDTSEGAHNKVRLDRLPTDTRLLFSQVADVTVANTVTETTLVGTGRGTTTVPANTLTPGSVLRITAGGYISDTGTPTLNVRLKLGGTEVASTGAQALNSTITDVDWHLTADIVVRSTGAGGTVVATGLLEHDGGSSFGLVKTSTTAADTTSGLAVDVTAEWGTADPADTITCQTLTIEQLNPPTSLVAATTDALLLETGFYLLLETGDKLLLE